VRLRSQLALFFVVMTGIILALGAMTVWGGIRIVDRFSSSLEDVDRLSQIRNLQNLLARQKASLDIYLQTREVGELEGFQSLADVMFARLKELRLPEEDVPARFQDLFTALPSTVLQGRMPLPMGEARALVSKLNSFIEYTTRLEQRISDQVLADQDSLRQVVRRGSQIILIFIAWELCLGALFALGTFRSLHRSLRSLQAGTEAFGQGHFDHRIDITAKDELGDLARSFNEMADNIKDLEVKTVHMHRMSAVGQLAGGVAHEINNPLTGVLGQAQILLEKLPVEDPRRSHAEKIERAAVRCRRIVRSLLDFSRQKEAHFAQYALNDAIDATLELCEPDLQSHRVTVEKSLSPLIPPMTGNSAQLQQVFLNLVSNAIHAMPKGGVLSIVTGLAAFVPPGENDGRKVDGIEVSVSDTGMGIAPEHLTHVFEPFFTTKEIGKGTGLGLSVSLGIVRNHGGEILAESEGKGKGATFKVLLPLAPPARIISSEPGPALPPMPPGPRF
jgi:signal transduction histidine kinase